MMEREASNVQAARQLQWVFSQARVALAVVLVKIRPSGVSARHYAETLASGLKRSDEGWKKEAQELQREVLRLRQELLMSRVAETKVASSGEAAGHEDLVDPASQDLFGPESPELQPGRDSKTPELPPSLPFLRPLEAPPHVGFLLALCGLRRVREDDRGLEALWLRPDGEAASLLEGSVCRLLASFVKACEEPPPLGPGDLGLQACRAVAQATDLLCSQRPPSAQFRRLVESTLEALTEMLLHRDLFSQLPAAEDLSQCLVVLGSSSASKPFLIRHLLTRLGGVAERLWRVLQDGGSSAVQDFPLVQYQNSFHLFWIVTTLLQSCQEPYRLAVGSDHTGFLAHLERRVFLLSEEFPLFSIYMWMIGGLLTSTASAAPKR